MSILLRPLASGDRPELRMVTLAAIRELAAGHYTSAQLAAWAAWAEDEQAFAASLERGPVIVAGLDGGGIAGYAQWVPLEHLGLLYVHPAQARRGCAQLLIEAVLDEARRAGAARVTTDASRVARPVFARLGFVVERVEQAERGGQFFERFRMVREFRGEEAVGDESSGNPGEVGW